ncbi:kinase-like domain-containing protein [Lentinula raphanica]|nr:kinase-like domain-containing protein [Lentinula raphanica]
MSPKYPKVAGYDLVQQIGGGGFSTVFRAVNLAESRVAACKLILITAETTDKERKTIDKETRIHSILKHMYVLELIGAVTVEWKYKEMYVPGVYMLLELAAGGDLFDKIAPDVGVGDDVAHLYFNQLLAGMAHIHSKGICHRDLKPENLLLDIAGNLKISDFGLSAVFRLTNGKTRALSEHCGSLPYVAPELALDEPYAAEPIDLWGIGVILFTLLAGNTPWDEPSKQSPEFRRYIKGDIFDEDPWVRFNEDALSLICSLLTIDPRKRMTLPEAMQHPWCIRASQLARQSPAVLADKLTESLRATGDMDYVLPAEPMDVDQADRVNDTNMDMDMDTGSAIRPPPIAPAVGHSSQFTQSLLLFSQTQSGTRYTPHLTRFYASLLPGQLMVLVKETVGSLGLIYREYGAVNNESNGSNAIPPGGTHKLRVGGEDARKIQFKGWIEMEEFRNGEVEGTFCVLSRDKGNPLSWRQFFKALVKSDAIYPFVLRKK